MNFVFSRSAYIPVSVDSSFGSNPCRCGSFNEANNRYKSESYLSLVEEGSVV